MARSNLQHCANWRTELEFDRFIATSTDGGHEDLGRRTVSGRLNPASVSVFTISAVNGSLMAAAGSPFAKGGAGLLGDVEFNCDGTLLYAAEGGAASSITDAWSVAASGALTPTTGSPFTATGSDSNVVFLTPDNTILYQSNQGSNDLNTFTVNPDGTLTSIGLASIAAGHTPAGLASDISGLFLFGADDAFGLAVFNIVPGVVPTLVGDTSRRGSRANSGHRGISTTQLRAH